MIEGKNSIERNFPDREEFGEQKEGKETKEQIERVKISREIYDSFEKIKPMIEELGDNKYSELDEKSWKRLKGALSRTKIEEVLRKYREGLKQTGEEYPDLKDRFKLPHEDREKFKQLKDAKYDELSKEFNKLLRDLEENSPGQDIEEKFEKKYENGKELLKSLNGLKKTESHFLSFLDIHAEGKAMEELVEPKGTSCPYCYKTLTTRDTANCPYCGVKIEKDSKESR